MKAKIYQPSKTAMQSGVAATGQWLLEFIPESPHQIDPLMGWNGSRDTNEQIDLFFPTMEAAVEYAKAQNIPYLLQLPKGKSVKKKAYADNFSFKRISAYEGKK